MYGEVWLDLIYLLVLRVGALGRGGGCKIEGGNVRLLTILSFILPITRSVGRRLFKGVLQILPGVRKQRYSNVNGMKAQFHLTSAALVQVVIKLSLLCQGSGWQRVWIRQICP